MGNCEKVIFTNGSGLPCLAVQIRKRYAKHRGKATDCRSAPTLEFGPTLCKNNVFHVEGMIILR